LWAVGELLKQAGEMGECRLSAAACEGLEALLGHVANEIARAVEACQWVRKYGYTPPEDTV
jgi:hypothetical protein